MGGIVAVLSEQHDAIEAGDVARRMTEAVAHRGPDDSGVERVPLPAAQLWLGHRRLSVLDLGRRGHQPMGDEASGSWVVFDGEIYNHRHLRGHLPQARFVSTSDTETLLRGWIEYGSDWLERLRGIFSLVLYDGRRRELWIARDPVGVKPLYYANPKPGVWLFASEVRAILASGWVAREMGPEGLSSYLAFGAVQAPWTILREVQSLLPGQRMALALSGPEARVTVAPEVYWEPCLPRAVRPRNRSRIPAASRIPPVQFERLRAVWEDAVAGQMISDVPVGVFLSGGIDSSAVVTTLARLGMPVSTFSIAFRERAHDESHSKMVAWSCGAEHHERIVSAADVVGRFDRIVSAFDQPSADGITSYTISRAVREAGVKVAISGLGGDEVFGGYSTFRRLARLEKRLGTPVASLGRLLAKAIGPLVRRTGGPTSLLRILAGSGARLATYCALRRLYGPGLRHDLMAGLPSDYEIEPNLAAYLAQQIDGADAVSAVSWLEVSLHMHNMLLRDTDQMSMAHGLEVRVPLVDHLLIDEVVQIPGSAKLPGAGQPNKWLLVELSGELLPREVATRPRQGFGLPWDAWLRRELKPRMEAMLLDQEAVRRVGLDDDLVSDLWQRFLYQGDGLRSFDILALAHLVFWAQLNDVRGPGV